MFSSRRTTVGVLGAAIDALSWEDAVHRILQWASAYESRYVCACNAHSLVTASLDTRFRDVINNADMAVPDGMPIAWSLWRLGFRRQERISGPDLMLRLCEAAAQQDMSIFLYGSAPVTLDYLRFNLQHRVPKLSIVGTHSPPFRELSPEEDAAVVEHINASGAAIVFIGLGCPKQEQWMAEHRGRIRGVMVGVGAAFDYHAGTLKRAPLWMQNSGLEWLFRLVKEPRRLWRRYLTTNAMFMLRIAQQFLRQQQTNRTLTSPSKHAAVSSVKASESDKVQEPIQ